MTRSPSAPAETPAYRKGRFATSAQIDDRREADDATTAASDTASLLPLIGRARPHAEKSLGSPDPGAPFLRPDRHGHRRAAGCGRIGLRHVASVDAGRNQQMTVTTGAVTTGPVTTGPVTIGVSLKMYFGHRESLDWCARVAHLAR
ncbi:MAG: DAK2 domain-containing protein, partial [Burkholderiaceae bacterium]|nr:DAK2 domain-containing protein [Microbacteriaceae bacterium]